MKYSFYFTTYNKLILELRNIISLYKHNMNKQQFLQNISRIHEIFNANESHLNTLSYGISQKGEARDILDDFLESLGLEKNMETYYIAASRIGDKKFEPLDIYLEKIGKSQAQRDELFEKSYNYVSSYYQDLQEKMLEKIEWEELLPEFYMTIFSYTHKLWKLYSQLFLKWNRKLLFEQNRELEEKFWNDQDTIISYLEEENLFDRGHHGERADRCYSLLEKSGESYISRSYAEVFPEDIQDILKLYQEFIEKLEDREDEVYNKKIAYIEYFKAIMQAWSEENVHKLVERWTSVDIAWMKINTPVQPGHLMEYYEDKYRRSVSIEFDMRLSDPSLFESKVAGDIANMYEGMYDEIGRENFSESYVYSQKSQKQVALYIGAPILQYGSFLCGSYSAQVVPNDDEVSKIHGKKIFAFPKFVLESQRSAPKMKLDSEIVSSEILEKYYNFLAGSDKNYYTIYDIETIGHEFGHTLWLTPGCEIKMWKSGLFKNIEEFKATAGGLVAHFLKGESDLDEEIIVTHLMRAIKMMRYREVEDILPYYCECLIHLHILFESGILSFESGKIKLHLHEQNLVALREMYIGVYTQQIFTYLNQMDAGNFLFEFVKRVNGVFLPKDEQVREFVERYYQMYKEIGNEVLD